MFLEEIAGHVREIVGVRRREIPPAVLRDRPLFHLPCRGFEKSLGGKSRHIIAEVKRASPSQGLIRKEFDAVKIAQDFFLNGASALSVLAEGVFFEGIFFLLGEKKKGVSPPLPRKGFILEKI